MGQLAIDFSPVSHARRCDPETSKEAAGRVREFAAGQCAAILAVLREKGLLGAEQIAAFLNIDSYQCHKSRSIAQYRPGATVCKRCRVVK